MDLSLLVLAIPSDEMIIFQYGQLTGSSNSFKFVFCDRICLLKLASQLE